MDMTATGAYGFQHGTIPVGSIMSETNIGNDIKLGIPSGTLGLGTSNPLFWLLILALVFTGWIFGAFDFAIGAKKICGVSFKAKAGR